MVSFAMKNGYFVCWVFSDVYASPIAEYRKNLWQYIQEVVGGLNVPWLLTGDFNQVVDPVKNKLEGSSA